MQTFYLPHILFYPDGVMYADNNIHLYDAISNLKLLSGATNKNVDKYDQLGTLR